ncbi:MAG TPA: hypothetical protein VGV07_05655 [Devosia sp.]|jgi:hypothetical protein|uniref:hypothetical protein n=1 Tax=Devosia sp. TaxID=1871048 RepID=UPI002DDCAD27|nr:hypothetical protein [Devosia sp.]HEV2514712.1 hypothetical protein [Devosia sp.]
MPKFMTYQRPNPVNKQSWAGRSGATPYQPIRKPAPMPEQRKLTLPPLPGGQKYR